MVVQWRLPEKFSSFIQRAGRAARGQDRTGVAVLLAESSAYSVDLLSSASNGQTSKKKRGARQSKAPSAPGRKLPKNYAKLHGKARGNRVGDDVLPVDEAAPPVVESDTANEGLHHFVQSTTCRREVLQTIYCNPDTGEFKKC